MPWIRFEFPAALPSTYNSSLKFSPMSSMREEAIWA